MSDDDLESVQISGDDPDLAALFCGQLRALGHPLPSHLAISELGDMVLCVLAWTPAPSFGLSGVAIVAMRELAEAHLHRRVGEVKADDMPGFKGAVVHFFLDGSTDAPGERAAALGEWSGQAQRTSRERLLASLAQGAEARRLQARSRIIRSEARRERRRHAFVA